VSLLFTLIDDLRMDIHFQTEITNSEWQAAFSTLARLKFVSGLSVKVDGLLFRSGIQPKKADDLHLKLAPEF